MRRLTGIIRFQRVKAKNDAGFSQTTGVLAQYGIVQSTGVLAQYGIVQTTGVSAQYGLV